MIHSGDNDETQSLSQIDRFFFSVQAPRMESTTNLSGRLPSILIFSHLALVTRFVSMPLHESSGNNSCYFIGLLSCESLVKPMLAILLPYKEVSYFKTFYWSQHVSVASSLKWGEFIAPPTVPYIAGHCSFGAEPFSPLSIDLLLIG